jgi:glycosyltransferase involved in cell wall biosynthesis
MNPTVSVIIPTYKRAPFLIYALEALKKQTYGSFEVIVVAKIGDDQTEKVLEQYKNDLPLRTIIQREGFVSRAYNLGFEKAKGEIIAIMDDDSVPGTDWLGRFVEAYENDPDLGGLSGLALSADFSNDRQLKPVSDTPTLHMKWHKYYFSPWAYNRPLKGMNDWLIFFGRDGLVHHRPKLLDKNLAKAYPSLLFMGANMSVRREAIKELNVDENLVLGFAYEQLLGHQIWRLGYKLSYDPSIKVLHIVHDESLGRFFKTPLRAAHREAEYVLTFFILNSEEQEVSWIPYMLELATLIVSRALSAKNYGFQIAAARIYGLLYGFVVGCAFTISKILGWPFSIKNCLIKFT